MDSSQPVDPDGVFSEQVRVPAGTAQLQPLYRRLGGRVGRRPRSGGERRRHARMIDPRTRQVEASAARVVGLIDGTQSRRLVTRIEHRPVTVEWVQAGCWRGGNRLEPVFTRLAVTCSFLDAEAVRDASPSVPLLVLDEVHPDDLEIAQANLIDSMRRHVERLTWLNADAGSGELLIVDGDLSAVPAGRTHLVGVVKQAGVQYWDEGILADLPHRHLGPVFALPPARQGQPERYCAQLRLVPAGAADAWDVGLIRLEAFDPGQLEPLAAYCLQHAQGPHSGDPRWDVHLGPMRTAETVIKNHLRPWTSQVEGGS